MTDRSKLVGEGDIGTFEVREGDGFERASRLGVIGFWIIFFDVDFGVGLDYYPLEGAGDGSI